MDTMVELEQAVLELADFIEQYLPLANAHNTDFITHDHWNCLLTPEIQEALLSLDDEELIALPIR